MSTPLSIDTDSLQRVVFEDANGGCLGVATKKEFAVALVKLINASQTGVAGSPVEEEAPTCPACESPMQQMHPGKWECRHCEAVEFVNGVRAIWEEAGRLAEMIIRSANADRIIHPLDWTEPTFTEWREMVVQARKLKGTVTK